MNTPCWTCDMQTCPYRLFTDCPVWQQWAAAKNRAMEADDE